MDASTLGGLYAREIRALRREIEAYPDDVSLWARREGIRNTGGALAQHLAGNLRHFIGSRLGGSGYVRDRDAEFQESGAGKEELLALVDAAQEEVARTFAALEEGTLESDFPDVLFGHRVRNGETLLHLLAHLGYHLGQIDYHRRMVTGANVTVEAISVREIPGLRPV